MKSQTRPYVLNARAAKMEETRRRILDAAAELYLQRGADAFTLEEAARRAGTTVQTILRIHSSRDRLLYAALDKLGRAGVPLKPTPPGDVAAAVAAIFDLYESIGDMVMQWLADERRRPTLKAMNDDGRRDHRDWVAIAFAPQLAARRGEARETLRQALIVATDVYAWQILRRDNGLPRAAAETVARAMIEAVANRETTDDKTAVVELVGRRQLAAEPGGGASPRRART
jgi:AcrR family transcriptional regulator